MLKTSVAQNVPYGGEFQGREALAKWQADKLSKVLRDSYRDVPHYRSSFQAAGVRPGPIEDTSELGEFPTIGKATLRDHGRDLYLTEEVVDFVSSSGTSGNPVILPVRAGEEDFRVRPITRVLRELGVGPDDRVLHNFNSYALYVFGYYSILAVRELRAGLIRMGPLMEERQVQILRDLRPTAFIANPHFMLSLAETASRLGLDPATSSLKRGLLATATPFGPDLEPRPFRTELERRWGLDLTIAHYGSSEAGPIGFECRSHRGYHLHEDVVFVERVDPETLRPVEPDEPGEVVVTHLDGGRGFTAIRYRTGDLVAWSSTEPCPCGRTTTRLGPVIGRVDQQIKLRGQNITPDFLLALIDPVPGVATSIVEAFRMEGTNEDWFRIKLGVEDLGAAEGIRALVGRAVAAHIPTAIPIEVVTQDVLLRQQLDARREGGGNKVVRFFDLR